MGNPVTLVDPNTNAAHVFDDEHDASAIAVALDQGWAPESARAAAARTIDARVTQDHSGWRQQVAAGIAGTGRGATLGLSDLGARLVGGEDAAYELKRLREANPLISTITEVGGNLASVPLTSGLGNAVTRLGAGAGTLGRVAAGGGGALAEGLLQESGSIASDLALADDPEEVEHIMGSIGSRYLTTGGISAGAGGALSGLEGVLGSTRRQLTRAHAEADAAAAAGGAVPEDIAALDIPGVRAARTAETARIEAEVVAPQRQALVQDINDFRQWHAEASPWTALATGNKEARDAAKELAGKTARAATKAEKNLARLEKAEAKRLAKAPGEATDPGATVGRGLAEDATVSEATAFGPPPMLADDLAAAREAAATARKAADEAAADFSIQAERVRERAPAWVREGGKQYLKADQHIRGLLNNMEKLGESTAAGQSARASMRSALQEQRQILTEMQTKADELKKLHALDSTNTRANALGHVDEALTRNRALQDRLDNLDAMSKAPTSPRLEALATHEEMLKAPRPEATLAQKLKAAAAYTVASGAVYAYAPDQLGFAAPVLGALAASRAIGARAGHAARAASAANRARQLKAIDLFTAGTRAVRKVTPPIASKVLAAVRFGPEGEPTEQPKMGKRESALYAAFHARSDEMARATMPGPDGTSKVRPEVRAKIAEHLAGLQAIAPRVADRVQTHAVRKIEFLDGKRPRSVTLGMTAIPPSKQAIMAWARYIAAAEDPGGVEERLNQGIVTPEDAETMRELYPERMKATIRMVAERLGTIRATLPTQKRLALALYTGAPVDAALEPRILAQLQSAHANEEGTEGGTQAPTPKPAFGSVSRPQPTPAQRRAG